MSTKVITIAQQKGGAGKTTISAHLAVAFANKGKKVAVIDIDPQASLSTWARIRDEKLGNKNDVYSVATNSFNLNSEIKKLQGKADLIIVDSPPHIQSEARQAIRSADLVILPVQPSPTDLWATKATLEITKQENVTAKILLNRVASSSTLGRTIRSVFEATAPEFLMKGQLGNRVGFPTAMLDGLTVQEVQKSSASANEIEEIIKEVAALIGIKISSSKAKAAKKAPAKKKAVAKKKTTAKKAATKKKAIAKKAASAKKKAAAKKSESKPDTKKKAAAKKATPKKAIAKKAAPKKSIAKKAEPKKAIAKKAATKKATAKKAAPAKKKTAAKKKAPAKTSNVTKFPVSKTTKPVIKNARVKTAKPKAKKSVAKKTTTKKKA